MAFQKQAHTQWPLNEDHHVDTAGTTDQQHGPAAPEQSGGHRVLSKVAQNIHYFTFLPLIIISVLSDISLVLAASICTGLVVCIILLSFVCYRAGIVKVFPKPFDLFNLALYGSMIPLSLAAHDWLLLNVSLLTNAGNAAFMWATILLPCTDNFVMHSVRDRVPPQVVRNPLMTRMALLISLTWATALTIMTAGAAIARAAKKHPTEMHPSDMIAVYVLGFGPLLLALPIQLIISHVYRKRLMKQYQQHLLQQQHQTDDIEQQQQQQQPQQQPGEQQSKSVGDVAPKGGAGKPSGVVAGGNDIV